MWIAHMAAAGVGPDPQNMRLAPLQSYDFKTFSGLTGTRYWPKMRCDAQGNKCEIGESGGPAEVCHETAGCAPPVDTKFEASFGVDVDWVDISLVDGFTLPFKFQMEGNCTAGSGHREVTPKVIDCSTLSMSQCPTGESLGAAANVNLQVLHPDTKQAVGCYSPCSKLTLSQWANSDATGAPPSDPRIAPYCCPTPPESPEACRAGPVPRSSFVQAIHSMCPGVYGFSYDDGMGLLQCSATTRYQVTFFCPSATQPAPPAPPAAPPVPPMPPLGPPGAAVVVQPAPYVAYVRKFDARRTGQGWEPTSGLGRAASFPLCLLVSAAVMVALASRRRPWRSATCYSQLADGHAAGGAEAA